MGKTTIKSTMIIDEFVHHPGSGRATDYQNDDTSYFQKSKRK